MTYIFVRWLHDHADYPILLCSELDGDRYETRKVEIFRGGRIGLAEDGFDSGGTVLGDAPVPSLSEIAENPEFVPLELGRDEFEALWQLARDASR